MACGNVKIKYIYFMTNYKTTITTVVCSEIYNPLKLNAFSNFNPGNNPVKADDF